MDPAVTTASNMWCQGSREAAFITTAVQSSTKP